MGIWAPEQLKAKKWVGQSFAFAQAKLDGWRVTGYHQGGGSVLIFGKDHRPHLEYGQRFPRLTNTDWFQAIQRTPPHTALDAEITVPGKHASCVATALREPMIPIEITTFAVPWRNGRNLSSESIGAVGAWVRRLGLPFVQWWPKTHQAFEDCDLGTMMKFAETKGLEGFVLKQAHYDGWFKIKREASVDVVVTDWQGGRGKYKGQVGALVVSLLDDRTGHWTEVAKCSGMTDSERKEMTKLAAQDNLCDRVCELKYQDKASKGRLRHPRFVRWREDKLATDCLTEQLD